MEAKKLVNSIKTKHVNYEVLAAAVLHLTEEEQVKVNKLIVGIIGLPVHATTGSIQRERAKRVDAVDAYDVILDAFTLVEKLTEQLDKQLYGFDTGSVESYDVLADAKMFIGSTEDEK